MLIAVVQLVQVVAFDMAVGAAVVVAKQGNLLETIRQPAEEMILCYAAMGLAVSQLVTLFFVHVLLDFV